MQTPLFDKYTRGYVQALMDMAELLNNAQDNWPGVGACQVYTYELFDQLTELADGKLTHEQLLNSGKDKT